MQRVNSVAELPADSVGVLLDQFGVLHDGQLPYKHAPAAVGALARGKQLLIISNSSRRASGCVDKLTRMGFTGSCFQGAVTSGELTHRFLSQRPDALGKRCIHITWGTRGAICLDGLGLEVVTKPGEADFILAHGTEALGLPDGGGTRDASLEELHALLTECAEAARQRGRELPLIVANPDLVTVDGPGRLITMPGTLAVWYKRLGGRVELMGKPDPRIYTACQELAAAAAGSSSAAGSSAATGNSGQQWLAIGDSLEHDIAGAHAAGMRTVFILGGIHAEELRLRGSPEQPNAAASWDEAALASLVSRHGVVPDYVMPFLQ